MDTQLIALQLLLWVTVAAVACWATAGLRHTRTLLWEEPGA